MKSSNFMGDSNWEEAFENFVSKNSLIKAMIKNNEDKACALVDSFVDRYRISSDDAMQILSLMEDAGPDVVASVTTAYVNKLRAALQRYDELPEHAKEFLQTLFEEMLEEENEF